MSSLIPGFRAFAASRLDLPTRPPVEHVQRANQMRRLLAFTGRSIDDVVNCPVARRDVISFFRIGKQMVRIAEVDALEQQWNPLRIR